jgi:hypothetical protein
VSRAHGGGPASAGPPDLVQEGARLLVLGLNPIPVRAETKQPVIKWKAFQSTRFIDSDSTTMDRRLVRWWGDTGNQMAVLTGANFGIDGRTGEVAGLVVLDADDDGARDILREHVDRGTVAVRTAHGFHVWFRHAGGHRPNRAGVAGVRLDVRGDGGYVLVPPSTGKRWIVSPRELWPPAPMPESLVELCWPRHVDQLKPAPVGPLARTSRYAQAAFEAELAVLAAAPEHTRNDTLNRTAFAVARFVVAGELPTAVVVDAFLRTAVGIGLSESESRATLASAISGRRRG